MKMRRCSRCFSTRSVEMSLAVAFKPRIAIPGEYFVASATTEFSRRNTPIPRQALFQTEVGTRMLRIKARGLNSGNFRPPRAWDKQDYRKEQQR
jgi:hypothetical protein